MTALFLLETATRDDVTIVGCVILIFVFVSAALILTELDAIKKLLEKK